MERLYPVLSIDAIVVKGSGGSQVVNRPAYVTIGVDLEGERDILGLLWLGPSGGEGAKQWTGLRDKPLHNDGYSPVR